MVIYFVRSQDRNMASVYWLTKGDLLIESEGLLMASQDQALHTRAVYSVSSNPQCQLCNNHAETVKQLISGCTQLAGTQYMVRHNNVAKYIHWLLYGKHEFQREDSWWRHSSNSVNVSWDFNIYADHFITARRPDIVVIDKDISLAVLINVSILADKNISAREEEKITKY